MVFPICRMDQCARYVITSHRAITAGDDSQCAAAFGQGNLKDQDRAALKMMPCPSATVTTFYELRSKIGRRPGCVATPAIDVIRLPQQYKVSAIECLPNEQFQLPKF
jgi:hypothetical protein